MGRLTRDPEIRYSSGEKSIAIARYTLAVDKKNSKEHEADFINCIAFGKLGEFAEKFLRKGTKIAVTGRIQTGSYTNKEGQKVYTTDVVVEEHDFCESRNSTQNSSNSNNSDNNNFMNIPDGLDEELPFM